MKYLIEHSNYFTYESPVDQSLNQIRLKPQTDDFQKLLSYSVEITPPSIVEEHVDIWENHVETFFIPEIHETLLVKAISTVSIQRSPLINSLVYSDEMKNIYYSNFFHNQNRHLAYLINTERTHIPEDLLIQVNEALGPEDNPVAFSLKLMQYIHASFSYDPEATTVETKASEAFRLKRGVCQDFAHIMIGILRIKGIPARYVSGYLYVPVNSNLVGDLASHAWVEVMVPGIGWIGLDPTNNVEVLQNHIRIGKGRDYFDVSPLQGVYRGGASTLDVKVSVVRLEE